MPTPEEPGQPHERTVLEPIRVLRPRNTDALAELFREMTELAGDPDSYEAVTLPQEPAAVDARTEEIPPVDARTATAPAPHGGRDWTSEHGGPGSVPRPLPGAGPRERPGPASARRRPAGAAGRSARASDRTPVRADPDTGLRRGAIAVGVCAAALVGFACALLLTGRGGEAAAQTPPAGAAASPTASRAPAATASADPDGAGTLREGDSGPEVSDLQQRLLRIPDVYDHGSTDGRYDTVLTEAVARFQLWYGIRGDESGVYGDDTRRDLESRTASGAG